MALVNGISIISVAGDNKIRAYNALLRPRSLTYHIDQNLAFNSVSKKGSSFFINLRIPLFSVHAVKMIKYINWRAERHSCMFQFVLFHSDAGERFY